MVQIHLEKEFWNIYGRNQVIYFCDGDENKVVTFFEGIEVISKN